MVYLREDERIDRLMSVNLDIIQSHTVFSFSIDAILLANFAQIPSHDRASIVDLCSGNGAVALMLSGKTKSSIKGIEIQERLADMATRSIQLNNLADQIDMIEADIAETTQWIKKDSVDILTCNPPYFPIHSLSKKNPNPYLAIARHEIHADLDLVMKVSSDLLKTNGKAYIVHRPDRMLEILDTMKKYRLIPKKIQFVYPKKGKEANILLIEAIKDGSMAGFKSLPPIIIYDENDEYVPEVRKMIYG
ncbi:tRNA1(Val) (adenine(37)-N6)-methyltransferase [Lacticigenium naphthae]|uniref:tRNA1(Val) (adenine(37)-N6)-methyltransferase n=1 Tax=Lacticigenium naphthae TaxID=515351 RepID=UPI00040C2C1C|nr:tRNA1(Val) (adenine(37)-N6)-methyltransferase [Lacticigenium naphthae]